jgi:hypothetical protein
MRVSESSFLSQFLLVTPEETADATKKYVLEDRQRPTIRSWKSLGIPEPASRRKEATESRLATAILQVFEQT